MIARPTSRVILTILLMSIIVSSCAHAPRRRVGVNIEKRPTPVQPDPSGSVQPGSNRVVVMTSQTLHSTIATIAADTAAARASLTRCGSRKLLPDQEGVFDTTTQLLILVREALSVVNFTRAQSLARQAKSLAVSIGCR